MALEQMLLRFTRTSDGIHIDRADDPTFRQYVHELYDLFGDALGSNNRYSGQIAHEFNDGISNFTGSPSFLQVRREHPSHCASRADSFCKKS